MSDLRDKIDSLVHRIHATFPVEPVPSGLDVVSYEDDECVEVQEAFSGLRWCAVPRAVLEVHYDDLPLLTPKAYHYYIPACLSYSLRRLPPTDEPWVENIPPSLSASDYQPLVDFTIYSLDFSSPHRLELYAPYFTGPQATVVREWPALVAANGAVFDTDYEAVQRVSTIWRKISREP